MKTIVFKPSSKNEWETVVPPPAPGFAGMRISIVEDEMATHAYARFLTHKGSEESLGRLISWFGEKGTDELMRDIREGMKNPRGGMPRREKIVLEWVGTREWILEDENGKRLSTISD